MSVYNVNAVFYTSTVVIFVLEGFLAGQTAEYYKNYPDDPYTTKIWVFLVNLVQLIHNALCGYVSWKNLIVNFTPEGRKVPEGIFFPAALSALESFAGFLTTSWFALRLWLFLGPRWRWIVVPTVAASSFVLAMGLLIAEQDGLATNEQIHSYASTNQRNFHIPWVAGNILADLLVAIPMVFKLHSTRSGFRQTDSILKSLSNYIVGTSLLTSIFALTALITLIALPDNIVWVGLIRIMSSIYSNTLLTFLNRRKAWNNRSQNTETGLHWATIDTSKQVNTMQSMEVTVDHNRDSYPIYTAGRDRANGGDGMMSDSFDHDASPTSQTTTVFGEPGHVSEKGKGKEQSGQHAPNRASIRFSDQLGLPPAMTEKRASNASSIFSSSFASPPPNELNLNLSERRKPSQRRKPVPVPDEVYRSMASGSSGDSDGNAMELPMANHNTHGYDAPGTDGFHAV